MRFLMLTLLLFGITAGAAFAQSEAKSALKRYQWKNRLILVFTPSEKDSAYHEVKNQTKQFKDELIDRDIVIFHLFENGKGFVENSLLERGSVNSLRQTYKIKTGKLTIVLIGKDGGEKLRQQETIDLKSIFNRIDAMPMRRMEMKQRKKE